MLFIAETVLGIQCHKCGKICFDKINAFQRQDSGTGQSSGSCVCGAPLYSFQASGKTRTAFRYPCIYCGKLHSAQIPRRELWRQRFWELRCPEKDLPVGYLGAMPQVERACQIMKRNFVQAAFHMLEEEETDLEFESFFAIYDTMEKLEKLGKYAWRNEEALCILRDVQQMFFNAARRDMADQENGRYPLLKNK